MRAGLREESSYLSYGGDESSERVVVGPGFEGNTKKERVFGEAATKSIFLIENMNSKAPETMKENKTQFIFQETSIIISLMHFTLKHHISFIWLRE